MKNIVYIFLFVFTLEGFFWGKINYKESQILAQKIKQNVLKKNCIEAENNYNLFLKMPSLNKVKKEVYKDMAQCYYESSFIDKSLSIYKLAIELYPKEYIFYEKLAILYFNYGFYDKALDLFLIAKKELPYNYKYNYYLGKTYASLGFFKEAMFYYPAYLIEDNFSDKNALKEYLNILIEKSLFEEAKYICDIGKNKYKDVYFYIQYSRISALEGNLKEAVFCLKDLELKNLCDKDCKERESIYLFYLKDFKESLKIANLTEDEIFIRFMKALVLYKENKNKEAREEFLYCFNKGKDFIKDSSKNFLEIINEK